MKINSLSLTNFRNFASHHIEFSGERTLILGDNGSGKSSLLEAIYFLSSGGSLRADREDELISFGADLARVAADLGDEKEAIRLEMTVSKSAEGSATKAGKINGVKKSLANFLGTFGVVEFGPEAINLVTGPPELRRRYLNGVLNQVSLEYRQSFLGFEKARKQKNSLLDQIREGLAKPSDLEVWNEQLLSFGIAVQKRRREFLDFLNKSLPETGFSYFPSELSPRRIQEFAEREISAGVALIGPHRDDFEFTTIESSQLTIDKKRKAVSLAHFGSRGQQRMAVFELKLGELRYFRKSLKVEPILLLDDIFSELDKGHRREVWQKLSPSTLRQTADRSGQVPSVPQLMDSGQAGQVILTATPAESIDPKHLEGVKVVKL